MNADPPSSKPPPSRFARIYGPSLVIGSIVGVIWGVANGSDLPRWVVPLIVAVGSAVVFIVANKGWRSMDEVALEAHKFAWFWGGSVGAQLAIVAALLMLSYRDRLDLGALPAADWIIVTIFATVGLISASYGIVWCAWWLRRR